MTQFLKKLSFWCKTKLPSRKNICLHCITSISHTHCHTSRKITTEVIFNGVSVIKIFRWHEIQTHDLPTSCFHPLASCLWQMIASSGVHRKPQTVVTKVLFKKMETKRSRVDFLTFLKTLSLLKSSLERGRSVVVDNTHVDVEAR